MAKFDQGSGPSMLKVSTTDTHRLSFFDSVTFGGEPPEMLRCTDEVPAWTQELVKSLNKNKLKSIQCHASAEILLSTQKR